LKKVKENWFHELKHATTTRKTKIAKVRAEPKTMIGTADVNTSAMLPRQCHLSDKLSITLKLHHVRYTWSHFQKMTEMNVSAKKNRLDEQLVIAFFHDFRSEYIYTQS